jgi:hypothetical protein
MLTAASLGMLGYGLWSALMGVMDLMAWRRLELLADLGALLFGLLLCLAAPLVRVRMPGGLALAIGALLGLQALALHEAQHLYGEVAVLPQVTRGLFAVLLVLAARIGARGATGAGQA